MLRWGCASPALASANQGSLVTPWQAAITITALLSLQGDFLYLICDNRPLVLAGCIQNAFAFQCVAREQRFAYQLFLSPPFLKINSSCWCWQCRSAMTGSVGRGCVWPQPWRWDEVLLAWRGSVTYQETVGGPVSHTLYYTMQPCAHLHKSYIPGATGSPFMKLPSSGGGSSHSSGHRKP